jgi:hypothetical protein
MTSTTRPELGELKPGQKVMVYRSPNDMRNRKPEEKAIPAVIVKASRVWIEIEKPGVESWSVNRWRMRRDTQDEGTQFSGSDYRFVTLEQHEWNETRTWALGVLKDHGLSVEPRSRWAGREAELADILAKEEKA